MEGMVRLSFYLFAAASIAVAAAWVSYVIYAVGFVRLRRTAMATPCRYDRQRLDRRIRCRPRRARADSEPCSAGSPWSSRDSPC